MPGLEEIKPVTLFSLVAFGTFRVTTLEMTGVNVCMELHWCHLHHTKTGTSSFYFHDYRAETGGDFPAEGVSIGVSGNDWYLVWRAGRAGWLLP